MHNIGPDTIIVRILKMHAIQFSKTEKEEVPAIKFKRMFISFKVSFKNYATSVKFVSNFRKTDILSITV